MSRGTLLNSATDGVGVATEERGVVFTLGMLLGGMVVTDFTPASALAGMSGVMGAFTSERYSTVLAVIVSYIQTQTFLLGRG